MRARVLWGMALLAAGSLAAGCRSGPEAQEPLPFQLALSFEGQESVTAERLDEIVRAELRRLEVATPDKAAVDDAAFALEVFYRSRGHVDARVDYDFDPRGPAASFRIHEGPEARVAAVEIEGATAFPPELLRDLLRPLAEDAPYDEERLAEGLDRVRRHYRERGYQAVTLEPPEATFDEARTRVSLRIVLHEGPEFRVRALEFEGGVPELSRREEELAFQWEGSQYKLGLAQRIENALLEDYHRRGYPDAKVAVRPELDPESGDVRLKVSLAPGERVTVAHIRIQGNARTKDATILDVMGIDLGSTYDAERERQAFRELYETGLFESITFSLEGPGSERTLVVDLVEARSVEIRLEPGWGSYEGPRAKIGIEENNFQGRGQHVALEGTAAPKAQSARVAWIDRDFLGTSFTSETTFYVEKRVEPSFTFVRRGFGFFLRKEWTRAWSSSLGYEFRPTRLTDDPTTPLEPDVESSTNVASVSVSLGFDARDSALLPTRGPHGLARFEWAEDGLGSDTEFLRARLELTHLVPAGRNVLALSARTGVIAPFGTTSEIPLPERFFNGGENTVRSFREHELQPEGVFGEELGGESATTLNVELRRELAGNLAGALFADWGNVTQEVQDYLDFDGFRTALGLGVRYQLPIGPMRLDLGWNPHTLTDPLTLEEEDEFVLHFLVGFPF